MDDGLNLVDLLVLDELDDDRYRGRCHAGAPLQVFGGQVVAQSLMAAGRTVDRPPHSLHATFLRRGDSRRPIEYVVDRARDGRTYSTRVVSAIQDGRAILTLNASFKHAEPGHDRQAAMPVAPPPEDLQDPYVRWELAQPELHGAADWRRAVDLRFAPRSGASASGEPNAQLVWLRASGRLPDDALVQTAALTYCSDLTLGHTAAVDLEPHLVLRNGPRRTQLTSLNHSVWFHRSFRADEWLLFVQRSSTAADGRGLSTGELWSRDRRLVASAAQEVVLRPPDED